MAHGNQIIQCKVKNCKFHNKEQNCTLHHITVGQECYCPSDKTATDCTNFELDTFYE